MRFTLDSSAVNTLALLGFERTRELGDGFDNEVDARSSNTFAATVVIDLNVDIGYGRVGQD